MGPEFLGIVGENVGVLVGGDVGDSVKLSHALAGTTLRGINLDGLSHFRTQVAPPPIDAQERKSM